MGNSESTVDGPVSIFCPLPLQSDMAWRAGDAEGTKWQQVTFLSSTLQSGTKDLNWTKLLHISLPFSLLCKRLLWSSKWRIDPYCTKKFVHRNFKELWQVACEIKKYRWRKPVGILPWLQQSQDFQTESWHFSTNHSESIWLIQSLLIIQFPITCSIHGSIYNETSMIQFQINLQLDTKSA